MFIASLVVIIGVVGVLMYALCVNPKLQEIGRISFAAAIFAICFETAGKLITLASR
jgi:uncharacterized membrane protein